MTFETLEIQYIENHIAHVKLNRQKVGNAMNVKMIHELPEAMKMLQKKEDLRCVILTGNGKHFSTGVDLQDPIFAISIDEEDVARRTAFLYKFIQVLQETITSFERLQIPVLVGIQNACLGVAIEFILAADVRICTKQSFFEFKEIDVGIAADMGLLQRLPVTCTNDSLLRELVYTGRRFDSETALRIGMVSQVVENEEQLNTILLKTAKTIAEKSPVAVWTIKSILTKQRHQIVLPNLDYMARLNSAMAQTSDIPIALNSLISKQKAVYPKL
ncbi:hypothetical protein ABPG74_013763 [Tetrahymena malaccensis]